MWLTNAVFETKVFHVEGLVTCHDKESGYYCLASSKLQVYDWSHLQADYQETGINCSTYAFPENEIFLPLVTDEQHLA